MGVEYQPSVLLWLVAFKTAWTVISLDYHQSYDASSDWM